MTAHLPTAMLAILSSAFLVKPSLAQDFRVDTDVFVDDGKAPVSETLTVFSGDVVYDFILTAPEETTVFDIRRGRIILLDDERQVKATLTTDQLLEFSAAIKSMAQTNDREGLIEPRFTVAFREETGELELSSEQLLYRAKGIKPKYETAARRFQEFADWYARLNAMRPGSMPPFGRLELNQGLAEHKLLPEDVERTVFLGRSLSGKRETARSHHSYLWTLSSTDRKRIEKAGQSQANFSAVTPSVYWQIPAVVSKGR